MYMIHRHMTNEKDKAYPWHIRTFYVRRDEIGTRRADKYSPRSAPQVEKPNHKKHRNAFPMLADDRLLVVVVDSRYDKHILQPWFCVWYSFENTSKRVRYEEREYQFH